MDESIRVLHVEDDADLAELVSTYLERENPDFQVTSAPSPAVAMEIIAEESFDCIVSDHDMPGQNGIEFLEQIRRDHPALPFILYTGKGSEEVASRAISAGVSEYLQKDVGTSQYTVLANRIRNAVAQYRTESELANREVRLDRFFEQSPLGVVRWDDEFNFGRVNDTACDILGYHERELVGESWELIIPESTREEIGDLVVDNLLANEGGYHNVNKNVRKDGEEIICEWHNWVVTDDDADVVAVYSQFEDITDREARKRALKSERDRFLAVFEESMDAMVIANDDGEYIAVNERATELFGLPRDELLGRSIDEFAPPDFDFEAAWQEFQQAEAERGTFSVVRPDGTERVVEYAASRNIVPGQHLSILRDVTDQQPRD